jgi:hypothetical protein
VWRRHDHMSRLCRTEWLDASRRNSFPVMVPSAASQGHLISISSGHSRAFGI